MSGRLDRLNMSTDRAIGLAALVFLLLAPLGVSTFWVSYILTGTLVYGIVVASLVFLSAYGGMVSLAQTACFGIAAFVLGNAVTTGETKGLNLGLNPWLGVLLGIGIATTVGLIIGAVSSRSTGIYFLMLTLVFSVIANKFFGQVTVLSGFGGIGNIQNHTPAVIGRPAEHPNRLYYAALVASVLIYLLMRYLIRTPFGLSFQGVRDDPIRMSSLGYNITLHRTMAFTFAAAVAAVGGILFAWWNNQISPSTISLSGVLDVLVMAVIGGLYRLEGAFVGAFVFVVLNNYLRSIPYLDRIGLPAERFHTLIGIVFLVIVLLSPGGLIGVWERLKALASRWGEHPDDGTGEVSAT